MCPNNLIRRSWCWFLFCACLLLNAPGFAQTTQDKNDKQSVQVRSRYFKNVAVALIDFTDANDKTPFPEPIVESVSKDLSWRVLVLPFCDGQLHYKKFNIKEAWDSETNLPMSKKMLPLFGMGKTGEKTCVCWIKSTDKNFKRYDIPDGLENTIMFMENPKKVIWSKPGDLTIDQAVSLVKNLPDGEKLIISFYDASTFAVSNKMDLEMFKAMLTFDGGEKVDKSQIK